jgi:glucosamine--fructose-6-phosphate aminotransferase (isomerizing)
MCGIVGYVGTKNAVPVLIEGLRRLEYRGYDSAGIAYLKDGAIDVRRSVGKLASLEAVLRDIGLGTGPVASAAAGGLIGIGHTRWATHGRPSEENAHPHRAGRLVLVHNGIIENYLALKTGLQNEGRRFQSETDTEVIVHLIDRQMQRGAAFEPAVRAALKELHGAYAICVMSESEPDLLIAARDGAPLVLGIGDGENFVASDIPAILSYTRRIIPLEDGEMAVVTAKGVTLTDLSGKARTRAALTVEWSPVMAEKGGYKHFMLKEIHEQPQAVTNTFRGRVFPETQEVILPELGLTAADLDGVQKIIVVACGTSWHAGLVGKFLIETLARIPVEVDIASEFRYRDPILNGGTVVLGISQSGETADTLAALKEAKAKGARALAVCNVVGSTMAREANGVLYTHAGPEIGVAATKTFTAQVTALFLLALYLGRAQGRLTPAAVSELINALIHLPRLLEQAVAESEAVLEIARRYAQCRDFLFLGRGLNYPIALEGALKLKEISYVHAEGYPAGEMKHGPIALIDENMPVVMLVPDGRLFDKVAGNIMEVKARGGQVIAVTNGSGDALTGRVDAVLRVPPAHDLLMPILNVVPLQLLAYHIAVLRGCDVDQPRNLAKSVTVE